MKKRIPVEPLGVDQFANWSMHAACSSLSADLFFPRNGEEKRATERKALAICCECPVRAECLEDALATESPSKELIHGIRGGETPDRRRKMMASRGKVPGPRPGSKPVG